MLYYNPQGDLVAGWINVWGDFPAHFAYSAPFAYRSFPYWFNANPIFLLSKFNYPFVADLISGLLIKSGFNLVNSFVFPSIVFSFLFLYLFYKFAYQQSKSNLVSFLTINIFLLSGGLGFYYFFKEDFSDFKNTLVIAKEYTHLENYGIKWINVITSELIPQRAFLIGLPINLFILYKLNNYIVQYKSPLIKAKNMYIKIALLGLLAGILPIIHMHSFIALFIFCLFLFLYHFKQFKKLLVFAIFVALPAVSLYFLFFYKQIDTKTFIEYFPGWMSNSKEFNKPILEFWWWNFGLFLPLSLISYFVLKLYKYYLYTAAIFIFILCHLYKFQPWAWDNSKLLTYWYLIFSIGVSRLLVAFMKVSPLKRTDLLKGLSRIPFVMVGAFLTIVLTLSGLLDTLNLANYKKNSYAINSHEELGYSSGINKVINSGDVVLSATRHNNPISNFTKAQVVMGYGGWLWSYGINFYPVQDDLYKMYRDPANTKDLYKKYDVKYVFISDAERNEFLPYEDYFDLNYQMVYKYGNSKLFKITN